MLGKHSYLHDAVDTLLARQEAERKGTWCLPSNPTASPVARKDNAGALNGVAL